MDEKVPQSPLTLAINQVSYKPPVYRVIVGEEIYETVKVTGDLEGPLKKLQFEMRTISTRMFCLNEDFFEVSIQNSISLIIFRESPVNLLHQGLSQRPVQFK